MEQEEFSFPESEINPEFSHGEQRGYQMRVKEGVLKALKQGETDLRVICPTGAGKTCMAVDLIQQMPGRHLILAPSRDALSRFEEELSKRGLPYCRTNNLEEAKGINIVLSTLQGLLGKETKTEFSTAWVDEAHMAMGDQMAPLPKSLACTRIYLTATPNTNHRQLDQVAPCLAAEVKYPELIQYGFPKRTLVQYSVNGEDWSKIQMAGDIPVYKDEENGNIFGLNMPVRNAILHRILHNLRTKGEVGIAFMPSIKSSEHFINSIAEQDPELKGKVRLVTGNTSDEEKKEIIQGLKEGRLICALTTLAWSSSVDIPEVRHVILADNCYSPWLVQQRIGRATRPLPGKPEAFIHDITAKDRSGRSPSPLSFGTFEKAATSAPFGLDLDNEKAHPLSTEELDRLKALNIELNAPIDLDAPPEENDPEEIQTNTNSEITQVLGEEEPQHKTAAEYFSRPSLKEFNVNRQWIYRHPHELRAIQALADHIAKESKKSDRPQLYAVHISELGLSASDQEALQKDCVSFRHIAGLNGIFYEGDPEVDFAFDHVYKYITFGDLLYIRCMDTGDDYPLTLWHRDARAPRSLSYEEFWTPLPLLKRLGFFSRDFLMALEKALREKRAYLRLDPKYAAQRLQYVHSLVHIKELPREGRLSRTCFLDENGDWMIPLHYFKLEETPLPPNVDESEIVEIPAFFKLKLNADGSGEFYSPPAEPFDPPRQMSAWLGIIAKAIASGEDSAKLPCINQNELVKLQHTFNSHGVFGNVLRILHNDKHEVTVSLKGLKDCVIGVGQKTQVSSRAKNSPNYAGEDDSHGKLKWRNLLIQKCPEEILRGQGLVVCMPGTGKEADAWKQAGVSEERMIFFEKEAEKADQLKARYPRAWVIVGDVLRTKSWTSVADRCKAMGAPIGVISIDPYAGPSPSFLESLRSAMKSQPGLFAGPLYFSLNVQDKLRGSRSNREKWLTETTKQLGLNTTNPHPTDTGWHFCLPEGYQADTESLTRATYKGDGYGTRFTSVSGVARSRA